MAYNYGGFAPYVPVAQRLARGRRALEKLAKKRGLPLAPVVLARKQIAESFWGRAWCQHLETRRDYESRITRGRTYLRNGSVLDLHIRKGKVEAYVAGSELYTVAIELTQLATVRWQAIITSCSGRIGSLIGLLRGELSHEVLGVLTHAQTGLFPAADEIAFRCSCPDSAYLCKHIAAVLYGVGARLDDAPELLFVLRQVDQAELIASASAANVLATAGVTGSGSTGKKRIAAGSVAALFGIELDGGQPDPNTVVPARRRAARVSATKSVAPRKKAAAPKQTARAVPGSDRKAPRGSQKSVAAKEERTLKRQGAMSSDSSSMGSESSSSRAQYGQLCVPAP